MAASLLAFLCHLNDKKRPCCVVVEAVNAACFHESMTIDDGKPHAVKGDLETVMAGLACGEPSAKAWEILRDNADAFMACSDQVAIKAMRLLANPLKGDDCVVSGESGSVTTGLVYELLTSSRFEQMSKQIGLGPDSKVLVISTEGDTDPDFYRSILE